MIQVSNVRLAQKQTEGSVVSMLQSSIFFSEGCTDTMSANELYHTIRVCVFRVHYLEQRVVVRYSTGKNERPARAGVPQII